MVSTPVISGALCNPTGASMKRHIKRLLRRDLQLRKQAFKAIHDSLNERDYIKREALEKKAVRLMNEARRWRQDHGL